MKSGGWIGKTDNESNGFSGNCRTTLDSSGIDAGTGFTFLSTRLYAPYTFTPPKKMMSSSSSSSGNQGGMSKGVDSEVSGKEEDVSISTVTRLTTESSVLCSRLLIVARRTSERS